MNVFFISDTIFRAKMMYASVPSDNSPLCAPSHGARWSHKTLSRVLLKSKAFSVEGKGFSTLLKRWFGFQEASCSLLSHICKSSTSSMLPPPPAATHTHTHTHTSQRVLFFFFLFEMFKSWSFPKKQTEGCCFLER